MRTFRWKQSPSGSSGPFPHTSSFLFLLWCYFLHFCIHTFGADRPKLQGGQAPASWSLDAVWPCWLASCNAFILGASSLQSGESKFRAVCPCFCRSCYRLKGFHCTWKIADFAVITSLLAQQPRRLGYLSGSWVSAARMLFPLLRGQRKV